MFLSLYNEQCVKFVYIVHLDKGDGVVISQSNLLNQILVSVHGLKLEVDSNEKEVEIGKSEDLKLKLR